MHKLISEAALKAGQIITSNLGKLSVIQKDSTWNFVTEADRRSEDCIVDFLSREMPEPQRISRRAAEMIDPVVDHCLQPRGAAESAAGKAQAAKPGRRLERGPEPEKRPEREREINPVAGLHAGRM